MLNWDILHVIYVTRESNFHWPKREAVFTVYPQLKIKEAISAREWALRQLCVLSFRVKVKKEKDTKFVPCLLSCCALESTTQWRLSAIKVELELFRSKVPSLLLRCKSVSIFVDKILLKKTYYLYYYFIILFLEFALFFSYSFPHYVYMWSIYMQPKM